MVVMTQSLCDPLIAHSANDAGRLHSLADHLTRVARLAARFAETFGGEEWAALAASFHDLGKADDEVQRYLSDPEGYGRAHGPDHSTAGAKALGRLRLPFSVVIAGHHGGLQNVSDIEGRLKKKTDADVDELLEKLGLSLPPTPLPLHQRESETKPTGNSLYVFFFLPSLMPTFSTPSRILMTIKAASVARAKRSNPFGDALRASTLKDSAQ